MEQVLRSTGAQIDRSFVPDGTPTTADGPVTVTITREDGTVLVTGAATTLVATGKYRYVLAPQTNLDFLSFAWTGTFAGIVQTIYSQVEIVGGFYVSIDELQEETNLASVSVAKLERARRWFERTVEDYTRVAYVPRYAREVLDGTGTATILLPHLHPRSILAASVDGVAATVTGWKIYDTGRIVRDTGYFPSGRRTVTVAYEHGLDGPPEALRDAALIAIREKVLNRQTPHRQYSVQTEAGVARNYLPGPDKPFGIADVDAVVNRLPNNRLVVA